MQHMDDKTGKPLDVTPEWLLPEHQPLTAAQKEKQREAMVQRLIELTAANNALYAQVTDALAKTAEHEAALAAMQMRLAFLERHAMPLTFWGRMRWLVRGV